MGLRWNLWPGAKWTSPGQAWRQSRHSYLRWFKRVLCDPHPFPSFSEHALFTQDSLPPQRNVFPVSPESRRTTAEVASPSVCWALNGDHSSLLLVKLESPGACGGGSVGGDSPHPTPDPRAQCRRHLAETSREAFRLGGRIQLSPARHCSTMEQVPFAPGATAPGWRVARLFL